MILAVGYDNERMKAAVIHFREKVSGFIMIVLDRRSALKGDESTRYSRSDQAG